MIVPDKTILTIILSIFSTINGIVPGGFIGFYGLLYFMFYTQIEGFWPFFIFTVPIGMILLGAVGFALGFSLAKSLSESTLLKLIYANLVIIVSVALFIYSLFHNAITM
ncbi:hypothetical protein PM8797T_26865 [Gimesia maris DSM 8797]|nr:hypothetical protein PM8797T_26865 [Gimesia maris DSM 8797]